MATWMLLVEASTLELESRFLRCNQMHPKMEPEKDLYKDYHPGKVGFVGSHLNLLELAYKLASTPRRFDWV